MEQNRERLASLGTMAAGLAHELNNPAAAARRAASDTGGGARRAQLHDRPLRRSRGSSARRPQRLVDLQREAPQAQAQRGVLDALDAADAEDEMLGRLEELGIPEAWRLAEPLAAAGVDADWLERVSAARGIGDRRRRCAGWRLAVGTQPRGASCASPRRG